MTVWFATGNIHKKEELSAILSAAFLSSHARETANGPEISAFELKIPLDAGMDFDPEETGSTFLENALIKARGLHSLLFNCTEERRQHTAWREDDVIIADDSGLCVDVLGGRPGILSARYGGPGSTAAEKNAKLLAELEDTAMQGARSARFVCAMVLYYGPDHFFAAQETIEGEIVPNSEAARGRGGFGYDPVFYIPELGQTMAELSEANKNRISHRGKAARAIARILSGGIQAQ